MLACAALWTLALMLLSIHEFMSSVALFVEAVQRFVYRSIFSKAAEKCLMKEENVLVKGGKPFSICCALYLFWNFITWTSVLTLKGWMHYLKNDLLKKKRIFLFFFSVLLYLGFYFMFSSEYFNTVHLPNWNLMCSEMFADKVPP